MSQQETIPFLYLILSTYPEIVCDVTVVPGISDHEAITFSIKCNTSLYKKSHKVYLLHKGNLIAIRADILKFRESFNLSDPYSNSINDNCINFKMPFIESIQKHILQKTCKSQRDLPWLNHKGIYHG